MLLKDIIDCYSERGGKGKSGSITIEEIYNNYGNIPVYSSSAYGPLGYYYKSNYTLTNKSIIYTLNGVGAGSTLLDSKSKDVWISNDTGVLELSDEVLNIYKKETIAVYLDYLFKLNRHNSGSQPKFSLKSNLELTIDTDALELIEAHDGEYLNKFDKINDITKDIKLNLDNITNKDTILVSDLIEKYIERGKRLTHGKDLYPCYGGVPVYSADIYGPMGYYDKFNIEIDDKSIIYTIDGKNAGSVIVTNDNKIWLTDHAGIIFLKKSIVEQFGRIGIATFLNQYFKRNLDVTGARPQFLLKKVLNNEINIEELNAFIDSKHIIEV